ncbi:FprA family A-type flavoprotein [Fusobacterium sp. PH5-44]|uniref:FprA family A-type flavoprotein n=1 Tax=unclassified Fusobacterium TaxID=2648384 RepID=UPI003D1DFF80
MVNSVNISKNISWIGVNDQITERFENYIPIPNGVTYNSFLIEDEKICIIDGVHCNALDLYLEKITSIIGNKKIDYIVINHVEPDHSSALKGLVKTYPDIKIIGNAKTLSMLNAFDYKISMKNFISMKEGEELDLGTHKLTFAMMPMVHWPESMVTYDKTSKILFSNDAFGGFGTLNGGIFDDEIDFNNYEIDLRKYYSNIVGKYGSQVLNILKKTENLDIKQICPSHGILWRKDIKKIVSLYKKWASFEAESNGVVIIYGSMYGNTAKMADILGRELSNNGITEVKIYDASKTDTTDLVSEIWKYKGLLIGSCAHNMSVYPKIEPLLHKLLNYGLKNRYLGIFGTMMWSGGGVKGIREFANKLSGLEVICDDIEVKGTPKEEDFEKLALMAKSMADKLK